MKNMNLQPGAILRNGGYRIIKELGHGGFGITYLAEQPMMERRVCIKEFFLDNFCERDAETSRVSLGTSNNAAMVRQYQAKFLKEAKTIARLDHKNIIRIYDVFEDNNTAYYVMEYIDGCSLADYVKEKGSLPEEEALGYIRQAAAALSYAHERKIMHLDVKPANMMLTKDGRIVLIDFGLSKQYTEQGEQTSSTPVGISHGYAPLEQYKAGGVSTFSPQTDVYSLGASLYRLVSGKTPPQATDIVADGFPARPAGISDATWSAITTAMAVRSSDRPSTVAEFLGILDGKVASPSEEDRTVLVGASAEASVPASGTKAAEKAKVKEEAKGRERREPVGNAPGKRDDGKKRTVVYIIAGVVLAVLLLLLLLLSKCSSDAPVVHTLLEEAVDTNLVTEVEDTLKVEEQSQPAPETPEKEEYGSIKMDSKPSGATIWLDGKNTKKKTPSVLEEVTEGSHNYRLVLEGYEEQKGSVKVSVGKQASVSGNLKEIVKEVEEEVEDRVKIAFYAGDDLVDLVKEGTVGESGVSGFINNVPIKKESVESVHVRVSVSTDTGSALTNQRRGEQMAETVSGTLRQNGIASSLIETSVHMNEHDPAGGRKYAVWIEVIYSKALAGSVNGHEWVDLGLSVKWATMNVGASTPGDYGNYYAWGEASPNSDYSWSSLKYCSDTTGGLFTKYVPSDMSQYWSGSGSPDNKSRLDRWDDAARQNWGGSWRMPTDAEWTELRTKCTWNWTSQNGHNGYKVTSKSTGNSIFLPAAGYRSGGSLKYAGSDGDYWSSSLRTDSPHNAWNVYFRSNGVIRYFMSRYYGFSVRPVTE